MPKSAPKKYLPFEKVKLLLDLNDESLEELIIDEKIKPLVRLTENFTPFSAESDLMDDLDDDFETELLELEQANKEIDRSIQDHLGLHSENLIEWLYLREPTQISSQLWIFQVASRLPESCKPDDVDIPKHDEWFRIERDLTMQDIRDEAAFLAEEIESYKAECEVMRNTLDSKEHLPFEQDAVSKQENYLDPGDYPDELFAAIDAYRAVMNGYGDQSATPRKRLIALLKERYPDLKSEARERVATVANPDKSPGRKKGGTK